MLRFILLLILGFVLWKIVQFVIRAMAGRRGREHVPGSTTGRKKSVQEFHDVRDADFEDLPPSKEGEQPKNRR